MGEKFKYHAGAQLREAGSGKRRFHCQSGSDHTKDPGTRERLYLFRVLTHDWLNSCIFRLAITRLASGY